MSSIKPKQGKCKDCDKLTALIGGRCKFHYWKYRSQLKASDNKAKGILENKYQGKRDLDNWYVEQIRLMPSHCENCNERLINFAPWALRSFVAHIVEKRNFKSVKTHPMNRVFLCLICHTNYDNWGNDKVSQMPVMSILLNRFKEFCGDIDKSEYDNLPEYLMELIPNQHNL